MSGLERHVKGEEGIMVDFMILLWHVEGNKTVGGIGWRQGMWFETCTFWGLVWFGFIQSEYLGPFALLRVSHLATQPWLGTTHEPSALAFRAVGHEVSATTPSFLLWYTLVCCFAWF